MNVHRPLGLRAKLLIAAALIALPGIILSLVSNYAALSQQRSQLPQTDRALAQTAGGVIDAAFDEATALAWSIATGPSTASLDPGILDPRLAQLNSTLPQYDNIIVVNAQGQNVGEMRPIAPGEARTNLDHPPYLEATLQGNRPEIGSITIAPGTGQAYVPVSVPVRGPTGQPIGAVVVALSLSYFHQRLTDVNLAFGRVLVITDPNGQLAYVSTQSGAPSSLVSVANVPLIHDALKNGSATLTGGSFWTFEGSWFGAAESTPKYHWVAAVVEPVGPATAPLTRALIIDLLSLALVLLLAAFGSYWIARQIVTPIRTLDRAARAWTAGDLSERVDIRTGDEFEHLGATFNAMAAALAITLQQLRQADLRLTTEGNRLRAILDTSPAGILVIDSSGYVILGNPAARSLLGNGFLLNRPIQDSPVVNHIHYSDGSPYRYDDLPLIRSLREGELIAGSEVLVRRPNGYEVHLLVNSAPIRDKAGKITGAVAVFFDISPLIEEERLRTEFVVSAAHEFRNPLTVIKGYAEVAMRDPTVRGTEVENELSRILDAANRVSRLADELLRSAELHLPPLLLRTEIVDLDKLVADVVDKFRRDVVANEYNITVRLRPARVEGDPALLSEAFTNLLRQAEAAMPDGGEIDVAVSAWDGIATVAVTDHGPMVSPERVSSLFTPFAVTSPTPTSTLTPRPTLLLYLTKRIVEESGGWIRAESTESGTTIFVTLPRYSANGVATDEGTASEVALTEGVASAATGTVTQTGGANSEESHT